MPTREQRCRLFLFCRGDTHTWCSGLSRLRLGCLTQWQWLTFLASAALFFPAEDKICISPDTGNGGQWLPRHQSQWGLNGLFRTPALAFVALHLGSIQFVRSVLSHSMTRLDMDGHPSSPIPLGRTQVWHAMWPGTLMQWLWVMPSLQMFRKTARFLWLCQNLFHC